MDNFKAEIENCRTAKQVDKILCKYGRRIIKDDSEEIGAYSVWISETERIYKPIRSKTMTYQLWNRIKMEYSGIPTFF